MSQIERSPVDVFCQSMRIAGAVVIPERLLLPEPAKARASGLIALSAPACGVLALIGPARGDRELRGPAGGTPILFCVVAGPVGANSLQAISPLAEASAKKDVSRMRARIDSPRD